MAKPQQPEKDLQHAACQHLSLLGFQCFVFAPVGGRPKCPNCGKWVGNLAGANPPGWPDVMVTDRAGNVVVFLEFKSLTGKRSREQEIMHTFLRSLGFRVEVPRSLEEAEQAVRYAAVTALTRSAHR